jgi:molybdopterin biosynthesis enzyme
MLAGRAARRDPTEPAVLEVDWTHRGDRPTYHPARVVGERPGDVRVEPLAWAGSADLLTVARSDGFVHFPAGDARYAAGSPARFLRLPVSRPGAAPTPP